MKSVFNGPFWYCALRGIPCAFLLGFVFTGAFFLVEGPEPVFILGGLLLALIILLERAVANWGRRIYFEEEGVRFFERARGKFQGIDRFYPNDGSAFTIRKPQALSAAMYRIRGVTLVVEARMGSGGGERFAACLPRYLEKELLKQLATRAQVIDLRNAG